MNIIATIIGKGTTAEVYALDNDNVVKLFFNNINDELIEYEIKCNIIARLLGLPVPKVENNIIKIGERKGIAFSHIHGNTAVQASKTKIWNMIKYAHTIADLHVKIHTHNVQGLKSQRDIIKRELYENLYLQGEKKSIILQMLDSIPDSDILCHGDFHTNNILVANQEMFIIDWGMASQGNPVADVVTTMFKNNAYTKSPEAKKISPVSLFTKIFNDEYYKRYTFHKPISITQIDLWKPVIAATRLGLYDSQYDSDLLKIIDSALKRI